MQIRSWVSVWGTLGGGHPFPQHWRSPGQGRKREDPDAVGGKLWAPSGPHQTVGIPVLREPCPSFWESSLLLLFLPQVQMVKMSELKEHLPRECLPEYLGGSLKLDPLSWNCRFLPQQNGHPDPLDELILVPLVAPKDNGSVHVPGPKSVTLQELLDHVSRKQKRGIYEEYEDIRRRSPAGTFVCSL